MTFAQGQALNPQGQGLKICPRGHLRAKDQGQGQQHWSLHKHIISEIYGALITKRT